MLLDGDAEMIAGLNDIVSRSNPSAQLTQSLARLSTRPAIQQLALEELEAAGYRDGVDVEHEELREIVCDKRAPETPEERLFANARELIEEIEELASEPFNVELIAYMHERLALDTKGLRVEPRPSPHRRPPCRHHLPISCSNRSSQDARIHACGVPILYSAR